MTGDDQLIIAKSFEIDYKCAKVSNQRSKNRCHKCLAWLLPTAHVRSLPVRSRVNALPADNKFWFDEKIMKICWFEKSFDSKKNDPNVSYAEIWSNYLNFYWMIGRGSTFQLTKEVLRRHYSRLLITLFFQMFRLEIFWLFFISKFEFLSRKCGS